MSALIAYRRFQNQEALELEYQARDLAKLAGVEFADIQSWAMPIVNANLARLRERRFDDTASAVALFEENLRVDNPLVREHASIELARLYFDKGQYQRVVALLRAAPDGPWSSSFSEKRELFAQLMFGIASQALGEPASKQRQRLFYLLYAQDKPGATEFIRKLKQSELGRS
jgi:hypothetical protein